MTEADSPFGAHTGFGGSGARYGSDPVQAVATAIRDVCMVGLSAVEAVLSPQARDAGAAAASEAASVFAMLAAMGDMAARTGGRSSGGGPHAGPEAELAPLLAQISLVSLGSGVRFWRGIAEAYARHQGGILRSMMARASDADASTEQRLILVDEIRSYLREVGDVSLQEARLLQTQLERISEDLARSVDNPDASAGYRRHWKTKP